jgi:hypothetical protein
MILTKKLVLVIRESLFYTLSQWLRKHKTHVSQPRKHKGHHLNMTGADLMNDGGVGHV